MEPGRFPTALLPFGLHLFSLELPDLAERPQGPAVKPMGDQRPAPWALCHLATNCPSSQALEAASLPTEKVSPCLAEGSGYGGDLAGPQESSVQFPV